MLSAGVLIWVSVRPLLRLLICTSSGYLITKADIFPLIAARGTGQIILNIAFPSLMFSKIVPAFNSDNISALGPLILVAFIYEFLGIAIAWLVKQFCWVPHRFRYGIVVAGGWGNYGDVPTAVIMSITAAAPFNPSIDQTLSVAYISAFILVFVITLFPMGGHRLIALDYVGPEVDDDEVRMPMRAKAQESFRKWTRQASNLRRRIASSVDEHRPRRESRESKEKLPRTDSEEQDLEKAPEKYETEYASGTSVDEVADELGQYAATALSHRHNSHAYGDGVGPSRASSAKHVSFFPSAQDDSTAVRTDTQLSRVCSPAHTNAFPSRVPSPEPSATQVDGDQGPVFKTSSPKGTNTGVPPVPESVGPSTTVPPRSRSTVHRTLAHARTILYSLLTPQALSILVALPIALIKPLKGLFVAIENSPIPNAPDGQPPLAFILDTCTFIGAASVPLGLICLGSALARMDIPLRQWRDLPIAAISWLAIGKMLVMPVLGVLITEGLVHGGLIKEEQKVLRFVCIFFSCVPTATTQVFLTQVYSGTGSAGHLSAFLIPQYALMFISMTALTAYSLVLIF